MPNWTNNVVSVTGNPEDIREFKAYVKGPEQVFDFNRIIEEPERLTESTSRSIDKALLDALKADWQLRPSTQYSQAEIDHAKAALDNLMRYGAMDWYDWRCQHWGTKWNACESSLDSEDESSLSYSFQTAWCEPRPIFETLINRFPRLNLRFKFHEETECEEMSDGNDESWRELWHVLAVDALTESEMASDLERTSSYSEYWEDIN